MKKIFLLLLTACCLTLATSCKKDDPTKEINPEDALKNTTWTMSESYDEMGFTLDITIDITFNADMTFTFEGSMESNIPDFGGEENFSQKGTWTYDEPFVAMTIDGETIEAEIKGDKMYIDDAEMSEEFGGGEVVFTKQ